LPCAQREAPRQRSPADAKDIFAHTATARNGDWDVTMPPKKTVTLVFEKSRHR
jgi:hypothetical protein